MCVVVIQHDATFVDCTLSTQPAIELPVHTTTGPVQKYPPTCCFALMSICPYLADVAVIDVVAVVTVTVASSNVLGWLELVSTCVVLDVVFCGYGCYGLKKDLTSLSSIT